MRHAQTRVATTQRVVFWFARERPRRWRWPKPRSGVALNWGGSGETKTLNVSACSANTSPRWLAFPGGFYTDAPGCVTVHGGHEHGAQSVKVGVVKKCPDQRPATSAKARRITAVTRSTRQRPATSGQIPRGVAAQLVDRGKPASTWSSTVDRALDECLFVVRVSHLLEGNTVEEREDTAARSTNDMGEAAPTRRNSASSSGARASQSARKRASSARQARLGIPRRVDGEREVEELPVPAGAQELHGQTPERFVALLRCQVLRRLPSPPALWPVAVPSDGRRAR